jgi:hypothetical protein
LATCAEAFHTSSRQRMPSGEAPGCEYPDSCTQLALPMPPSAGQLSTGSASSAAVSDQDHRPLGFVDAPLGLVGDHLRHQRHAACRDVDPALATVRRPPSVVPPRQPRARGRGVHLEMGHPLPIAEVRFAQPRVDEHRLPGPLAERDRGIQGAPQVRRHDDQGLPFRQHFGGCDGLVAAQVGQLGVELALHPVAGVVPGLAVTQHHQSAHPHGVASRSTCTTGQSRHNRSRA